MSREPYFPIQPRTCRFCGVVFTPVIRKGDVCPSEDCQAQRKAETKAKNRPSPPPPPKPAKTPAQEIAELRTELGKAQAEAATLRKENKRLHRVIMELDI